MFKVGDHIIYYGSSVKLHRRRGIIQGQFGDRWRIRLEGGYIVFATEQELDYLQQSFAYQGQTTERYLDDLM